MTDDRILMVSPQPFFENRGVPISTYLRCEALNRLDVDVDMIAFPIGSDEKPSNVTLHRIPNPFGFTSVPAGPSLKKLVLDFVMFFYLFYFLIVSNEDYEILLAHEEGAFFTIPHAWVFGLTLGYEFHSNLSDVARDTSYGLKPFLWMLDRIENIALQSARVIISAVPAPVDELKGLVGHDRVFCVYDAAPEEVIHDSAAVSDEEVLEDVDDWLRDDRIKIIYTGSFAGYQRMDQFIEGFGQVENRDQFQVLLVGGTDREVAAIREQIANLGLEDCTKLTGRVDGSLIPSILSRADVLASPRTECRHTPLKIYTYMWAGKPLLVSDVTCHRVIFEDDEVVWADPSPSGYARGIELLAERDLDQYGRIIRKKYREEFDFDQFVERHRPVLQALQER
jgi:glycosyltransferase involved in cell wall biosynthesis